MVEKRPFDVLNNALGKSVLVRMKGSTEFRGTLGSFDQHINLVLEEAEELEGGQTKIKIGTIFLRGDTIVFVSPA